jgi:uncharacterized protein YbaR (Trm112 family)
MFIELVDALRCPVGHEESWLVATFDKMEARHIVTGTLGCPVCKAEYPVRDGVVDFRHPESARRPPLDSNGFATDESPESTVRLAALLDLSDASGFAVLVGAWGRLASALAAVVETPLIAVNPRADVIGSRGVSVIRCEEELPLATGAARAIAVDISTATRMHSALRVTRTGARVVAPVAVDVPRGLREMARDAHVWVSEREPTDSPLVTLHVRRG